MKLFDIGTRIFCNCNSDLPCGIEGVVIDNNLQKYDGCYLITNIYGIDGEARISAENAVEVTPLERIL